jgi:Domain of unknown function (DUF4296)
MNTVNSGQRTVDSGHCGIHLGRSALGIVVLMLGLCACNGSGRMPIPEKKLVLITVDMHYAEAALQNVYGTQKDSLKKVYYDEILQLHQIKKEDFEASMRVLQQNAVRFDRFYNEVKTKL